MADKLIWADVNKISETKTRKYMKKKLMILK
jgi:hypothetical protein